MNKPIFFFLILISLLPLSAQNLIKNPSFEDGEFRVFEGDGREFIRAQDWFDDVIIDLNGFGSSYDYTPDPLYSQLGDLDFLSIDPFEGEDFIYMVQYNISLRDGGDSRARQSEYFFQELEAPLEAGAEYEFSYMVHQFGREGVQNIDNNLCNSLHSVFFRPDLSLYSAAYEAGTKVENDRDNKICYTDGWTELGGCFTATGNERYVVFISPEKEDGFLYNNIAQDQRTKSHSFRAAYDNITLEKRRPKNPSFEALSACAGSFRLNADFLNATWFDENNVEIGEGQFIDVSINQTTTYTIQYICGTETLTVPFDGSPQTSQNFLPADTTLCEGSTLTLNLPQSVTWQDGSTSNTFTITQPGIYTAELSEGGCTVTDNIEVSFEELPTIDLGADRVICGEAITIGEAIEGVTHSWSDGDFPLVREVSEAGTYILIIERNGCIATDEIEITEGGGSSMFLPSDTLICGNDIYNITLSQEATWSDGSVSTTFTIEESGIYWAEVESGGCIVRDSIEVNYEELPELDLGSDQILCEAVLTIGEAIEGVTHSWSDGDFPLVREVSEAGTYILTIERNGCIATDEIEITEGGGSSMFLPSDTLICGSDIYNITLSQEATWSDGSVSTTFTIEESGIYWAEVESGGCIVRDSIEVNYEELPELDLGADQILCEEVLTIGQQIEGVTHSWSDGDFPLVREVSEAGTYILTIERNGCIATDSLEIIEGGGSSMFLPSDTLICGSDIYNITLSQEATWSDGSVSTTFTIEESGIYWAEVESGGCTVRDSIEVNYEELPELDLGLDQILCEAVLTIGESIEGVSHSWSDGDFPLVREVSEAGTYILTIERNGCIATDSLEIIEGGGSSMFLPSDTLICGSDIYNITLSQEATWSDGSVSTTFTIEESGIYWAEVESGGCTVRDSIEVNYEELPELDLGADQILCEAVLTIGQQIEDVTHSWSDGDFPLVREVSEAGTYVLTIEQNGCSATDSLLVLEGGGSARFLPSDTSICGETGFNIVLGQEATWSDGSVSTAFEIIETGIYWAEVTEGGCTVRDSIEVTFNAIATIDLGADRVICGEPITIGQQLEGVTHSWSDGDFPLVREVSEADSYVLTIEQNGCSATDSLLVLEGGGSANFLPSDTSICGETDFNIVLDQEATWSDGSISTTFEIIETGIYWAEVTEGGCTVRDSIEVTFNAIATIDLGADRIICGEPVIIGQQIEGVTHSWSDGDFPLVREVSEAGTYILTIEQNGCSATDSLLVLEGGGSANFLPSDTSICGETGFNIVLDQEATWSDGSISTTFEIIETGIYWAEVTEGGCTVRDSLEVVIQLSNEDVLDEFEYCVGVENLTIESPYETGFEWWDGTADIEKSNFEAGNYFISYQLGECTFVDSFIVSERDCSPCSIEIPNVITENPALGQNGSLQLFIRNCNLSAFNLKIYDRWGTQVYEALDSMVDWEGQFRDQVLQNGVYVVVIEYQEEGSFTKRKVSEISIIR